MELSQLFNLDLWKSFQHMGISIKIRVVCKLSSKSSCHWGATQGSPAQKVGAQFPVMQQSSPVPTHSEAPNMISPYSPKLPFLAEKYWISSSSFYSYVPPQLPKLCILPTLVTISSEACSGELLKKSRNYNKSDCWTPQESSEMHKYFLIIVCDIEPTVLYSSTDKYLNTHPKITRRKNTTVSEIGVRRQKKPQIQNLGWECKIYQNTSLRPAKIVLNCCICCINIKQSCPKIITFLKTIILRGRETQSIKAVKNRMHLRSSLRGFYPHELYMSEQRFSDTSSNSASPHPAQKIKPPVQWTWAAKRAAKGCSLDWCQPKICAWKQKSPAAAFALFSVRNRAVVDTRNKHCLANFKSKQVFLDYRRLTLVKSYKWAKL